MIEKIVTMRIVRLEESEEGTFGNLIINGKIFCTTLEPADRLNESNKSSIPEGQYICERFDSPKYGDTFEIKDVPGRFYILFHPGNFAFDTMGCVLLGEKIAKLREERAIANSGNTFKKFLEFLEGENKFHLTINKFY
jgi:hypothetical protein